MICEKIEHFRYTCTPDEAARLVAYLLKCGFWFKVETSDGVKVEVRGASREHQIRISRSDNREGGMKKVYLGDGLYAEFDGFQFRLYTDREDGFRHEVYLDADVLKALLIFAKDQGFKP